jgi:hypothetical protein
MKKLILLVTLLATFGASAGQITHEQLVKINKFNKGWTNIVAVQNKGVSIKTFNTINHSTKCLVSFSQTKWLELFFSV